MATRPPPQTKTILATPLNVEESKAQRQQRSQARFRDRGGIFIPSNRNTLADILLGKAPPLTKPRKSVSASPSLRRQSKGRRSSPRKSSAINLRRSESPVKQSRKSIKGGSREVVTNVESLIEQNVVDVSTKAREGKKHSNPAARRPSTKGSKTAPPDDEEHNGDSNMNPGPPKKTGTKGKPSKKAVSNDVEAPPPVRKPKFKAKSVSKDATMQKTEDLAPLKKAAGNRAPRPSAQPKAATNKTAESNPTSSKTTRVDNPNLSNMPTASSSSAKAGPSTSARPKRRKSGDLYSCGESEDEYVPRVSKKKLAPARTSSSSATAPAKKPAQGALPAIIEEDEDQEGAPKPTSTLHRPSTVPAGKSKPVKTSSSAPKSSSKAKDSATESSKSSSSKNPVTSNAEPKIMPKESKSRKGSSRKGKEVTSDHDPVEIAPQKTGPATSTKSNKRRADDTDPAEERPEPPTKRPKSASTTTQNAKATSDSKKAPSKKRYRDIEDDDDDAAADTKAASAKKTAKRKKTADGSDTDIPPPSKPKKGSAGVTKAKTKPTGQYTGGAKKASKKPAKKAGQNEKTSPETSSQPQAPVVKRGPPKSVLARIKASAQIYDVDNDPDEIDFLS